jgi:hypothetical protein
MDIIGYQIWDSIEDLWEEETNKKEEESTWPVGHTSTDVGSCKPDKGAQV